MIPLWVRLLCTVGLAARGGKVKMSKARELDGAGRGWYTRQCLVCGALAVALACGASPDQRSQGNQGASVGMWSAREVLD